MTRAYVPATPAELAEWYAAGRVPAGADRVLAAADDEESEYDALMTAAALATSGRRVVVVAEAAGDAGGELPLRTWAAVHADAADRAPDADPDEDLAWFGVQEIPGLL